jgi:stringent starvation protein B
MNTQDDTPSTRPYLIRAMHEWCVDNGFSPYIAVHVDGSVQVPQDFVKDGEIVLNVSFEATSGLRLGNDFIEFKARFGGVPRDIIVPVTHVVAIYARENGQGMAFAVPPAAPAPSEPAAGALPTGKAALRSVSPDALAAEGTPPAERGADPEPPDGLPPAGPAGSGGSRPQLKRVK